MSNLARGLRDAGQATEAERLFLRAIANLEQALGRDHALTQRYASHYARLLCDTERAAEALPLAQAALAAHERDSGPHHSWTQASARVTADALAALGRADEAAALWVVNPRRIKVFDLGLRATVCLLQNLKIVSTDSLSRQ